MKLFLKIFLYCVILIISMAIGQIIGAFLSGMSLQEMTKGILHASPYEMMLMEIFSAVFVFLATFIFVRSDKQNIQNLGFNFNINLSLQGFVLGGIFIALFFVLLLFANQITLKNETFDFKQLSFISIALFFAAFIEEISVRGYILRKFSQKLGNTKALIISSGIFACMHLFNPNLGIIPILEIFLAGLVLGYAYLKTNNIWFVTFIHLGWNLIQTLVGFNVSGEDFYSILNFSKVSQNIFTGGDFGFEGSILSMLAMVFMYLILRSMKSTKSI